MTREQKLALIIGFSLILAVGVLISDHLSRARTDTIIADAEIDRPMVVHSITDVPPGIGESGLPLAGRDAVPAEDPGVGMPITVREPLPGMDQANEITEPSRGGLDVASLSPRETVRQEPGLRTMADDSTEADAPVEVRLASSSRPLDLPMFEPVDGSLRPTVDSSLNTLRQVREPVSRDEAQAEAKVEQQQPVRQVTHVVAEGETLYGIAARYYGNGDLWPELLKANKAAADAEGRVFEGARLVIPQRGTTMAQAPVREAPATTPRQELARQATQQPKAGSGYGSYTIQKGDTLSEISQELMGTVRRMNELIELNKDQIRDADDIRVGMKLRYPLGQRA